MQRIARFARNFSILIFLGVLLFVYAYLPDQVGIAANEFDKPNEFIDREMFFYATLGVFILVNLLFVVGAQMLDLLPVRQGKFFANAGFKEGFIAWVIGLGAFINLFLIALVSFIGFFNNADYYHISKFSAFAYMGQAFIFIWIVLFFYLIFKKK